MFIICIDNEINIALCQILDTLHNSVFHSFDMGYRIKKDYKSLSNNVDNKNDDDHDDEGDEEEKEANNAESTIKCGIDIICDYLATNKIKLNKLAAFKQWTIQNEMDTDDVIEDVDDDDKGRNIKDHIVKMMEFTINLKNMYFQNLYRSCLR